MKKIYQFVFIVVNSLAINTFAQTNACNELFIAEIIYSKDNLSITGNSPLANSYAIELFNPKGTEVNLSDYSIKMYSTEGNETIIPLIGNITSKGTFVLGFTLSDEAIIQIAEMLSTSLDFTRQNSLELWGPNGLIDRVGDINISEADAINIAAAIADPVNYLNTLNLNLGSLTNLVARRKHAVVQGNPSFVEPANDWTIAPNGDVSNLGDFQNVCSVVPDVGFTNCNLTLSNSGGTQQDIGLTYTNGFGSSSDVFEICQVGGNAVLGFSNDYSYSAGSASGSCVTNSNFFGGTNPFFISISSFLFFSGTKTAVLALECTSQTANISSCNLTVTMIGSSNSVKEFLEKHQLIIQTTNVDQNLIVKTNTEQFNFEIIDIFGKQIQYGSIENSTNQINVVNLSSGLYLFKVKSYDGESTVLKFNKI